MLQWSRYKFSPSEWANRSRLNLHRSRILWSQEACADNKLPDGTKCSALVSELRGLLLLQPKPFEGPMSTKRSRLRRIVPVLLFIFVASALVGESEPLISRSSPAESLCLRRCRLRAVKRSNTKVRFKPCFRYYFPALFQINSLQYNNMSLKSSWKLLSFKLREAIIWWNNLESPELSERDRTASTRTETDK